MPNYFKENSSILPFNMILYTFTHKGYPDDTLLVETIANKQTTIRGKDNIKRFFSDYLEWLSKS